MRKIFKYGLEIEDEQTLELPKGYEILKVTVQYGMPVLYALVDVDTKETEEVLIITYGTGHVFDESYEQKYLGTCAFYDDTLMLHYFHATKKIEEDKE